MQSLSSIEPDSAKPRLQHIVSPARVLCVQLAVTLLLAVVGILARIAIYSISPSFHEVQMGAPALARLLSRFDLGFEPSLAGWYSSVCLLSAAFLLFAIGLTQTKVAPFRTHWLILGVVFVALSVDEVVMFHETLSSVTNSLIGPTKGPLYFAWVIPGAVFVLGMTIAFGKFVFAQEASIRNLFILSAAIFVSGALGVEMVEGVLADQGALASLQFTIIQALEESCEMVGVAIFTYALLRRWWSEEGVASVT